jgi:hypothetical protein
VCMCASKREKQTARESNYSLAFVPLLGLSHRIAISMTSSMRELLRFSVCWSAISRVSRTMGEFILGDGAVQAKGVR